MVFAGVSIDFHMRRVPTYTIGSLLTPLYTCFDTVISRWGGLSVAWRGVVWRGVAWRGVAWRSVAWRSVAYGDGARLAAACSPFPRWRRLAARCSLLAAR